MRQPRYHLLVHCLTGVLPLICQVTALCKKHTSLDAVFQDVQWLSISAYEALGDAIDASHEQVLTHLERVDTDREFFGALVLWVHSTKLGMSVPC